MAIDVFFQSLAEDAGSYAMGVILSGTGTDGTQGLGAIKAAGGFTFVQSPASAKFDGMPRSALDGGYADFCLNPEAIADEILMISTHRAGRRVTSNPYLHGHYTKLSELVKQKYNIDLNYYKINTIERRIDRRMAVHKIDNIKTYVRLCESNAKELTALRKDLLINVTGFFRDREPFNVLKRLLHRLIKQKKDTEVLRVWVAGCATGEEAYSIGICILEVLEAEKQGMKVQVFATDLDEDSVQRARKAIYPPSITDEVGPDRLQRYFERLENGYYQVASRVRDMVVFSIHNITSDPPFSKVDLVSCRNVLIYFKSEVQRNILSIFHYALKPEGHLMLGTSESAGCAADLFSMVDKKNKFYSVKKINSRSTAIPLETSLLRRDHDGGPFRASLQPKIGISHLADRRILEQYAPPGALVNENFDVVYFRGSTERYLSQPSGTATHNILSLVRPQLHGVLKKSIERIFAGELVVNTTTSIDLDAGEPTTIMIIVQQLIDLEMRTRYALILFKESLAEAKAAPRRRKDGLNGKKSNNQTDAMSLELALTKDYLQSMIEAVDNSNEELRFSNEELQSSNEELQSTNEELETSKEELQSTNEELTTLNDKLQIRMSELTVSNGDLQNILLSMDYPVVVLGSDLKLRQFSEPARKLLRVDGSDVGRHSLHLHAFLGLGDIDSIIIEAIEKCQTVKQRVQASNKRVYTLKIVPYESINSSMQGAVISLMDIDAIAQDYEISIANLNAFSNIFNAFQCPVLIINGDFIIVWVNESYCRLIKALRSEVIGFRLEDTPATWCTPRLKHLIKTSLITGESFRCFEGDKEKAAEGKHIVTGGSILKDKVGIDLILLSFPNSE